MKMNSQVLIMSLMTLSVNCNLLWESCLKEKQRHARIAKTQFTCNYIDDLCIWQRRLKSL